MITIGVIPRLRPGDPAAVGDRREPALTVSAALSDAVARAGGAAWVLPPVQIEADPAAIVARCDGLLLQGGPDLTPSLYYEVSASAGPVTQDAAELQLLRAFLRASKPVLGICRGCQLLNVAFGGTLYADVPTQLGVSVRHSDPARYVELDHAIELEPGGYLQRLYAIDRARANSAHHQGIRRLGEGLVVEARSADGLVEAIRWRGNGYAVGLQWHPEFHSMAHEDRLDPAPLFADFVEQARRR